MLFRSLTISLASLFLMISCNQDPCLTKEQFVDSYQAFFTEFESRAENLETTELEDFEQRYARLLDNCFDKFKTELSIDERKAFWRSSVSFYLDKEGGLFNVDFDRKGAEDPVREYIVSELEELADSSSSDLALLMESVLEDELPRLIDSFVGRVEKVGDAIKDSLEK